MATDAAEEVRAEPAASVCIFAPVTLLTVTLERAADDGEELHLHPGGQGVWQARMVVALEAGAVLCTVLGGETGLAIGPLLEAEGVGYRAPAMQGANAAWIQDRREGERHSLWESAPPPLGRHELDELYSVTLAEALAAGVCLLAGTHESESVVDPDVYRRLVTDLVSNDVAVVCDLTGAELEAALQGSPTVVKVSDEDLVRDGLAPDDSEEELLRVLERLHGAGAQSVVVSRAGVGALASREGLVVRIEPPELEVADSRGAGDSMTAALGVAFAQSREWGDALCLAAAAGAVNVTRHGSGSGHAEAVEQLAQRVTVTELEAGTS